MSTNVLTIALCVMTMALGSPASAQTPAKEPTTASTALKRLDTTALASLEREFWRCDHAATQALLDSGTAEVCGAVTEALKARRFGGDFTAMVRWWRAHKDAEHRAASAASPPIRTCC
jgi:hypothetical protein